MIELTGKEFNGKGGFIRAKCEHGRRGFDLRFGEDKLSRFGKFLVGQTIEIISLNDAGLFDVFYRKIVAEITDEVSGVVGKRSGFFDEKAMHGGEAARLVDGKEVSKGNES